MIDYPVSIRPRFEGITFRLYGVCFSTVYSLQKFYILTGNFTSLNCDHVKFSTSYFKMSDLCDKYRRLTLYFGSFLYMLW